MMSQHAGYDLKQKDSRLLTAIFLLLPFREDE